MKHCSSTAQKTLFEQFLEKNSISLSEKSLKAFYNYAEHIKIGNESTNLISKNDVDKFLTRHVADSLIPYAMLKNKFDFTHKKWADMGAGAGCPVVPLAIALPETEFYAVEPRAKRVSFLHEVKKNLGLENLTIVGKRFETSELKELDFVSCRALSTFENDWERARNALRLGGFFLTLKSLEKISHLKNDRSIEIYEYQLPNEENTYALVCKRRT